MDGIGTTLSAHTVAGVKAANQQVRALGAGYSQLLQGAAAIAATGGQSAPALSSGDPNRGQNVDILV